MKLVIDTNCILASLPKQSKYRWFFDLIRNGNVSLAVSTEILEEYEEILAEFYSPSLADNTLKMILELPKLERIEPIYRFDLISVDVDDNKFVDCAIACGADYIITHDKHFNVLKNIPFPKVETATMDIFKEIFEV